VTTHAMSAWPGRVDEQRREPLDPAEQGHVVDLDASLGKEHLEVPVGRAVWKYHRTPKGMTSGGNRNPANAHLG
jgi:hypothetical protein